MVFKHSDEKRSHGVFDEPVGDLLADRCIQQVIVERQSVDTLTIDPPILLVVGVDPGILREIVCNDLRSVGLFDDPIMNPLNGRTHATPNDTDVLQFIESGASKRIHCANEIRDSIGVAVAVLDGWETG